MSAAATIAAAAAQKDMVWIKTGKIAKKPKLTDPLQMYSLAEVVSTEGTGGEAVLTCKVVDSFYDKPMNFLPQGGGLSEGETTTVVRKGAPRRPSSRRPDNPAGCRAPSCTAP
eukprot:COSAG04_NODE_3540_length_2725_cov_1.060548_2_plen_113_part_00